MNIFFEKYKNIFIMIYVLQLAIFATDHIIWNELTCTQLLKIPISSQYPFVSNFTVGVEGVGQIRLQCIGQM